MSLNLGQNKTQTMVKYIPTSQTFERFFMKILKWIVLNDTRDFSLYHSHITFICLVYKLKLSDFVHVRSVTEKKEMTMNHLKNSYNYHFHIARNNILR